MRQNILVIILAVILIGVIFVWYQFLYVGESEIPVDISSSNPFEDQLAEIRRLRDLKLNTDILHDDFFKTLEAPPSIDTTGTRPGRENPFIPF